MISRRQFTVTLVLTPLASWLAGACGGSDDGGGGGGDGPISTTNPTTPLPTGECDGVGAQSSVVNQHTHALCVPASDLSSPPSAGATYTTTTTEGHTHQVTLDAAQLSAINRGDVITLTTSIEDEHLHSYSLARAGTITPPPQPGSGGPGPY